MASSSVVLRVWGVPRVGPALLRVAGDRRRLRATPGVRFAKQLGTGSGHTFTPRDADPRHWALLTTHPDDDAARAFATSAVVRGWDDAAHERLVVTLTPLSSRGRWSGAEPFAVPHDPADASPHTGPVAALTRARLRTSRTLSFWTALPPVVADLGRAPGLRLAVGVGEAPVGLQGTFSLWESARDLVDFAYRSEAHRAAVRQTGPERWYAEELFARFAVDAVEGTYRGVAP